MMPRMIAAKNTRPQIPTLRQYYERKNRLLVLRTTGGLGDILMHRMMFEDMKKIMPDSTICFAVPPKYYDAVKDHPYIDEILDCRSVNQYEYIISYNTTSACTRHEMAVAPYANKNRSDIWANHCGVELTNHDMHIKFSPKEEEWGKKFLNKVKGEHPGPVVIYCPVSAMYVKNMQKNQTEAIVEHLRSVGCFVCGLHGFPVDDLTRMGVPTLAGLTVREWMCIINAADYVVSVDTAGFHMAGGIKKPLTGIFTFADGKVYGKYYDFILVQMHRDNGNWDCGPCYNWSCCPKTNKQPKPCLTEITPEMLIKGIDKMLVKWKDDRVNVKEKLSLPILNNN